MHLQGQGDMGLHSVRMRVMTTTLLPLHNNIVVVVVVIVIVIVVLLCLCCCVVEHMRMGGQGHCWVRRVSKRVIAISGNTRPRVRVRVCRLVTSPSKRGKLHERGRPSIDGLVKFVVA